MLDPRGTEKTQKLPSIYSLMSEIIIIYNRVVSAMKDELDGTQAGSLDS